ncbi:D-hexose-6-phosphate mutarotase [Allochromatium tepidum]|uniref:Putative glucose-6-phosphate 1-epimerase n=1 Tax=Allochromatium tepidum TaxID=553982 RepID=A0ABM7QND9_9GAMM|nr:D-hexose-6-phosphate mutarotase [Allochromatium tepidum]BCU07369.1 D-hexose-6-phosphate mutarotase [Allochromatium tepidum]
MDLDALNAAFALPNVLRFVEGQGGLTLIEVDNGLARATLTAHGAQVLSYRPAEARDDLLFVSERAYFAPDQEIKGGVPICWPWFGRDPDDPERIIHGFARLRDWSVPACEMRPDGAIWVRFGLADDESTRALRPHYFNLWVEVTVGATLSVSLTTRNAGDEPFTITQGLHAYFKIGDPAQTHVLGLDGCRYLDKAADAPPDAAGVQSGSLGLEAEVNRIYESVPQCLTIEDKALSRRIRIESHNSHTCVVWNPWIVGSRSMPDLDDEDYRRFVCVETVNAASEVIRVAPRQEVRIGAEYRLESL